MKINEIHVSQKLKRATLIASGTLLLGGATYYGCEEYAASKPPFSQEKYHKKYKIVDKESYAALYEAALPIAQISMMCIENLKGFYCDNNSGIINTFGLGSYYFPVNGEATCEKWVLTSQYYKQHPNDIMTGDRAFALSDAWCRTRNRYADLHKDDKDTVYKLMYEKLKGCELTPYEYAAILSCTYQNENKGFKFCDFVRKNYQDPIKCAAELINYSKDAGLLRRHTGEALVYLNVDDYISCIPSLLYEKRLNARFDGTSVNQLAIFYCKKANEDLQKGSVDGLRAAKNNICNYVNKNAVTVAEFITHEVSDKTLRKKILGSSSWGINITFTRASNDLSYKQALEEYNKGNYEKALQGFKTLVANGANGAGLHNDIAITHYNLGHYQECIDECKIALATGERSEYQYANYNAGKAYEALKNYSKASQNYHRAAVMAEEFNRDTKVYEDAAKRMDTQLKNQQQLKDASKLKGKGRSSGR